MNKRSTGVTVIELLVMIAIVAILSLVVAPSFVRAITNMRLQGVGNELVADLHLTRSEALSRNLPVQLVTQGDGRGYSIVTVEDKPQPLKTVALPASVVLTANIKVQFDPLRAMTGTDTTLLLESGGGTRLQLSANPSGKVQMCSPQGSLPSVRSCA